MTTALRGVFGRHEGEQRWFPGSSPALTTIARADLEVAFPVARSTAALAVGTWPGRGGATWIRNIDGTWFIARAVLPPWSVDRSIPAWAVIGIDDSTFASAAMLPVLAKAVHGGVTDPTGWLSKPMPTPAADVAWDASAIGRAGQLLATLAAGPGQAGTVCIEAALLDHGGLLALQGLIHAAHHAGVGLEAAVLVAEPLPIGRDGWPAQVLEAAGTLGGAPAPPAPMVGTSPVAAFIRSFADLSALLNRAMSIEASANASRLELAARDMVPLSDLPPSAVARGQLAAWARGIAGSTDEAEGLGRAERILGDAASTPEEVLAGLHLLAAWAERHPDDAERRVRNLISRRAMDRGPGTSPA